jgi:hypothetical protein
LSRTIVERIELPGAATSMTPRPRLENEDRRLSMVFAGKRCIDATVTTPGSSVGMSWQPETAELLLVGVDRPADGDVLVVGAAVVDRLVRQVIGAVAGGGGGHDTPAARPEHFYSLRSEGRCPRSSSHCHRSEDLASRERHQLRTREFVGS